MGVAIQWMSQFLENIHSLIYQSITLILVGLLPQANPNSSNDDYIEQVAEILMSFSLSPLENKNITEYMSELNNKMSFEIHCASGGSSSHSVIPSSLICQSINCISMAEVVAQLGCYGCF